MTLNARIAGARHVKPRRVHDGCRTWLADVLATRTMTFFAPDVPLSDLLRLGGVIHRMTTVAERPGRTLHVPGRIERYPPIGVGLHRIRAPDFVRHVPLCGQREVIVANFRKVALLPLRTVDESNV